MTDTYQLRAPVRRPLLQDRKTNLEIDVQFQVKDQTYFLSLAENERRWLVYASTPRGAMSIPVYVDGAESEDLILVQEAEDKKRIPN